MIWMIQQNGIPGACGHVNVDSAWVIAIDQALYNGGKECGRKIAITYNGKTSVGVVADMCPTCSFLTSLPLLFFPFTNSICVLKRRQRPISRYVGRIIRIPRFSISRIIRYLMAIRRLISSSLNSLIRWKEFMCHPSCIHNYRPA